MCEITSCQTAENLSRRPHASPARQKKDAACRPHAVTTAAVQLQPRVPPRQQGIGPKPCGMHACINPGFHIKLPLITAAVP